MDILLILSILSGICSILSFFLSKIVKAKIWGWIIIVFFMTFACGYAVHYNSELERIKSIHRQAKVIYEKGSYFDDKKQFIQEVLIFLEENRDCYPDAYERAKII